MNYSEQLKDPRWQRKRLEAMQRDRFTCQLCFHTDKHLNVHHKRYVSGAMPWEYDIGDLITICDDCHTKYHREETKTQIMINTLRNVADRLQLSI